MALESTVISHGLPFPRNLEVALLMEETVRREGAEPRTVGVLAGQPTIGLDARQIERLARANGVRKVSPRDLPVVVARGIDGATTVAGTMWLAARAGISVIATGGIGGVHRASGAAASADVSADIEELARTSMVVVCAGAKAILDLSATLEQLETRGVTVVGFGTDQFPAFYSRSSGLPVDARCDSPEEVAALFRARLHLGLPGAILVAAPVPAEAEIPRAEIEPAIARALSESGATGPPVRRGHALPSRPPGPAHG